MSFAPFRTERFTHGSNLILPPDLIQDGGVRVLQNSRLTRMLGTISSRAGMSAATATAIAAAVARSIWTLFGSAANFRYAHVGTTLYRLASAWTGATSLATSIGTNPASFANMVDGEGGLHTYMTNSSGLAQRKDDGTTLRTWGIAPPTAAPSAVALATDLTTTIDNMDSSATWTLNVGLSAGPTNEANIKQEGTNSQTITIAAAGLGSIARGLGGSVNLDTLTGGDATVKADDYLHLWVRADRPERISYVQLDVDVDTATVADAFRNNYYSVKLPGSVYLNQGRDQWTKVQASKSIFQRFGTSTSLSWADAKSVRLSFLINAEGACQIYLDDLKLRGGTDIKGNVRYTACYRRDATGARGNPPLTTDEEVVYTTAIDVDRQRVSITTSNVIQGGAAHPGDAQIDQIRLYRSIDKGSAFQIDEIADTTASPYVDDVSVGSLILGRTLESDNNVPPNGEVVFGPGALNRLFMLAGRNDLYFSKSWERNENRAENWPPTFRAKVGDGSELALSGLVSDTTVLVWTDQRTYTVQGYGADTFLPVAVPNSRGVVGRWAVAEGDGRICFVSQDGIYAQLGLRQVRLTDGIAPFFAGLTVAGQAGWNTAASALADVRLSWQSDALGPFVLMLYPEAGSSTINRELYLGRNVLTGEYTDISFDRRGGALVLTSLHRDPEANRLYGGSAAGLVYQLEDTSVETDGGNAMAWRVVTRSEHQGRPANDKYYAQALIEANTRNQSLTVVALWDKQATTETLTQTLLTNADTETDAFTLADVQAMRQDIALELSGTISNRIDFFRYGAYFEVQPEALTFWDSGVMPFGWQAVVQGVWYALMSTGEVVVRVILDQQPAQIYTIIGTGGQRRADRFYCLSGATGRQLRVTLESPSVFRLYEVVVKVKAYGTASGFRGIPLLREAP